MKQYRVPHGDTEFFIRIHNPERAEVFTKVMHVETGKGWSAAQDVQEFTGPHAAGRAMGVWMRAARLVAA